MSDETKAPENVPYIVYEITQARNERHIKRLSVEYFNPKLHNATIQKLKQL